MNKDTGTRGAASTETAPRRLAVRVSEAARLLDIGRSKAYELIRDGALPAIRIGGTVRVPLDALEAWVAGQAKQQAQAKEQAEAQINTQTKEVT
jgi:excisionase family DNA binding protein